MTRYKILITFNDGTCFVSDGDSVQTALSEYYSVLYATTPGALDAKTFDKAAKALDVPSVVNMTEQLGNVEISNIYTGCSEIYPEPGVYSAGGGV